jgi:cytochrome b6-f complex subunit 5
LITLPRRGEATGVRRKIIIKNFQVSIFVSSKIYFLIKNFKKLFISNIFMVEPLLSGIVLGLVPVTLAGLFVTAYLQYRRGDQLNL